MGADHYGVLGVERAASRKEIRAAYLRLARKHHPDRAGGSDDRMAAVNEAWEVLSDDRRRRRHDRDLARRDAVSRAPMAPVIRTAPSAGTGPVDYDPVVPARTFSPAAMGAVAAHHRRWCWPLRFLRIRPVVLRSRRRTVERSCGPVRTAHRRRSRLGRGVLRQ